MAEIRVKRDRTGQVQARIAPESDQNKSTDFSYSVSVARTVVAENFADLADVNTSNLSGKDKYVVQYNARTQKFELVNPDKVLSDATTMSDGPGLPSDFLDQLDTDLDDRIDMDAGSF